MKILIATEAWDPQVNGVVRTLKMTSRELMRLGHDRQSVTVSQHSLSNLPGDSSPVGDPCDCAESH